ncbi:MAG: universal stress protein [Desulfobacteraceae bacterium]|nr:universal stress protein [Desulfobacteraceae bacterium]MCF8095611.1 universal stress protein [Desulfobacteraceae bacterium]
METQMLHIFRNTPLGRETLLQTSYFCKHLDILPVIYIPRYLKFLMYFENEVVQVDLDSSYLRSPDTARDHALQIVKNMGLPEPKFLEPKHFTASTLPDIPVDYDFMSCPRSISDLTSKIGLGYIGPRVRRIVHSARFPVLIPSSVFKPWKSLAVLFGGSANAVKTLRLGMRLSSISGLPLDVFTQEGRRKRGDYENIIQQEGLNTEMDKCVRNWRFFESRSLAENLYEVPDDALIVVGAYGHGLVKELLFGSTMEIVQSICPNSMLIVGPNYRALI